MSFLLDAGQKHLRGHLGQAVLCGAALIAVLAAVRFLTDEAPMAVPSALPATPEAVIAEVPQLLRFEVAPEAVAPSPPSVRPTPVAEAEVPLAFLETRFHASSSKQDRIEIAGEIAGRNDAEAVAALGRLFQLERHPEVKVALLANLNDVDRDTAPAVRLRVLAQALRGQPRDVRTTALDSLAQLDDPQVAPLLRQAVKSDPDREVRDIAAALYRARFEPER